MTAQSPAHFQTKQLNVFMQQQAAPHSAGPSQEAEWLAWAGLGRLGCFNLIHNEETDKT